MPKIKQDEVMPMKEYNALTHWKDLCTDLLDALREIQQNTSKGWVQDRAKKALKEFERNK